VHFVYYIRAREIIQAPVRNKNAVRAAHTGGAGGNENAVRAAHTGGAGGNENDARDTHSGEAGGKDIFSSRCGNFFKFAANMLHQR